MQIYSANWLPTRESDDPSIHRQHNALCLETQHYPDSINQPQFPNTVLKPSEKYDHVSVFSFHALLSSPPSPPAAVNSVEGVGLFILSTSGRESSVRRYRALLTDVLQLDNTSYVTYNSNDEKIDPAHFTSMLRKINCVGGAISKDIKASVVPHLDEIDDTARKVASVNTIVKTPSGGLKGYNTDAMGFEAAIRNGVRKAAKKVKIAVVYGYGGVTNIVAYICCSLGYQVYLTGRRPEEASRRSKDLSTLCGKEVNVWSTDIQADLFINAAPVTDKPLEDAANFLSALEGCSLAFDHEMPGQYLKTYCEQNGIMHIPGVTETKKKVGKKTAKRV